MKASKGSKGPPPHHDQWKLSCKMLITLMDNILSERNDKTCRMKWVTCYKLPCTRCPCQSPWHFPIGKKHQLAHRVRCAKFVKTFLLLWNTSSLISAKTRVENGLLFVYYRRNCSHPFQLLYTDNWSWLINSYRSCTLHLISDTRWPWIIVMNSITPENWGLCTVQGKEYWMMSTLLQVIFCRDGHSDSFWNPNRNICTYSVFQKILFRMPISSNLFICEVLDLRSKIHIQDSPKRRVIEIRTLRSHRWESKPRVPLSSMISQQLKLNRCFRFTPW